MPGANGTLPAKSTRGRYSWHGGDYGTFPPLPAPDGNGAIPPPTPPPPAAGSPMPGPIGTGGSRIPLPTICSHLSSKAPWGAQVHVPRAVSRPPQNSLFPPLDAAAAGDGVSHPASEGTASTGCSTPTATPASALPYTAPKLKEGGGGGNASRLPHLERCSLKPALQLVLA